jgi:hydrogenase expression/formation protein HypE
MPDEFNLSCPLPLGKHDTIQMAHGGGGRVMQRLIDGLFVATFSRATDDAMRCALHDSTILNPGGSRVAFTTDTFVVSPLFFPGGDIGKLAVCGTVNDLAMSGADPKWLSAGFILEEGFPIASLEQIVQSMQRTAEAAGVRIVTGDTKVVDRGKGDGIFINTAGIGLVPDGIDIRPERVRPGDVVLVSGDVGRHGIAIMSVREGLQFEGALESDCDCLGDLVAAMRSVGAGLHCLRDLTRGGLASALNEIATSAKVGMELKEVAVPVAPPVAGACEMLGLDPFYVANEGRLVAIVSSEAAESVLQIMQDHPAAPQPAVIGRVSGDFAGCVELHGELGGRRILDLLSGEQMPRIC